MKMTLLSSGTSGTSGTSGLVSHMCISFFAMIYTLLPEICVSIGTCDDVNSPIALCQTLASNQCSQGLTDEDTGITYACDIGAEACGCVEMGISTSVVFLIDAGGIDELSDSGNDQLWENVLTYWPTSYVEEIAMNQVENGNVDYTWILFSDEVYATGTYAGNGATFPWDDVDELPDTLSSGRSETNLCKAWDAAMDVFEENGKTSKTIIYAMFNDPDEYECTITDTDINFLLYRWGEEVDTDLTVRDYFYTNLNGNRYCYYQDNLDLGGILGPRQYVPENEEDSDSLFRDWQETASDFVCGSGIQPTPSPTDSPTPSPVVITEDPTPSPTPSPIADTPSPTAPTTGGGITINKRELWWSTSKNGYYYWQRYNNNNYYGWGMPRYSYGTPSYRYGYGYGSGWGRPDYGYSSGCSNGPCGNNGYQSGYSNNGYGYGGYRWNR